MNPTVDDTQRLADELYDGIRRSGGETVIVPGSDGLNLAYAGAASKDQADRLCASISGVASLLKSIAKDQQFGGIRQTIVDMDHGYLVVVANRAHGNSVAVLCSSDATLEHIVYEVTALVEKIGKSMSSPARFSSRDGR